MKIELAAIIISAILIFFFLPVFISGMPPQPAAWIFGTGSTAPLPPAAIASTITCTCSALSNQVKLGSSADIYSTITWNYQGWMVADMVYAYRLWVKQPDSTTYTMAFTDLTPYESGGLYTAHTTVLLNQLGTWIFQGDVQSWTDMSWHNSPFCYVSCVAQANGTPTPIAGLTITVEVHVVDPQGLLPPLSGVTVQVLGASSWTGKTGSNGKATSPTLAAGDYTVTAAKAGYTSQYQYSHVDPSTGPQTAVFYLQPSPLNVHITANPSSLTTSATSTIVITVDFAGTLASGASMSLTVNGGYLTPTSGSTDSNGQFSAKFSSSAAGTFTIKATASKAPYQSGSASIQIAVGSSTPPPPPVTKYTLTISSAGSGSGTTNPASGTYTYNASTVLSVTATSSSTSTFTRWEIDGTVLTTNPTTSITMNGNHALVAIFTLNGQTPPPPPPQPTWWDMTVNFVNFDTNWWYNLVLMFIGLPIYLFLLGLLIIIGIIGTIIWLLLRSGEEEE